MVLAVVASLAVGLSGDVQSDARFDDKITIQAEAITAEALCGELTEKTGVQLSADAKIREDIVVLFAKRRPAKEILDLIGKHFEWQWKPDGEGYVLRPSPKFAGLEAASFREHLWGFISKEVAHSRESSRRPRAPRNSYRAFRQLSDVYDKLYLKETRTDAEQLELERVRDLMDRNRTDANPFEHFSDVLFSTLTADDAVLMDGSRIVYSTRPKGYQRPFPPQASVAVGAMLVDLSSVMSEARAFAKTTPPKDPSTPQDPSDDYDHLLPPSINQWFDLAQISEVRASVNSGGVHVTLLDSKGKVLASDTCYPPEEQEPSVDEGAKPSSIDVDLIRPLTHTKDLVEAAKDLEEPWRHDAEKDIVELVNHPDRHPLRRYAHLLGILADESGHTIISDAYDPYVSGIYKLLRPTIDETFGRLSDALELRCKLEDGVISLRSKSWGYLRRGQVPTSVYQAIARLDSPRNGFTFDDVARASAMVTPLQADSFYLEAFTDMTWSDGQYYLYRAWNEVPSAQREALKSGTPLASAAIPPRAKAMFEAWAYRLGGPYMGRGNGCGTRSRTEYDEPDFEEVWGKYDPYIDVDSSEALPLGSSATLTLRFVNMPGAMFSYSDDQSYYQPPSSIAYMLHRSEAPALVRYAERDAHRFRLQLRDNLSVSADCSGNFVGKDLIPELTELPEALRKRVIPHLESFRESDANLKPKSGPPPPTF